MKYKIAIFDMDGTILNTADEILVCANTCLREYGFPEIDLDAVKAAMGEGTHRFMQMVMPSGVSNEEFDSFMKFYLSHYHKTNDRLTAPYPGICELLADLKAEGVKLAVISSKPEQKVIELNGKYFNGIFDLSIGDDRKRKLKPAPDSILFALDMFGAKKEEAIFVGDSEFDIKAAANAGIDCIAVSYGYRKRAVLEALNPYRIADDVEELRKEIIK